MELNIYVGAESAEDAITSLVYSTSPPALAYFMHTRALNWLQRRARDRFATEGDDASGGWQLLTDATVNIREAKGFVPIRINRRTSELHNWVVNAEGAVVTSPSLTQLTWPGPAGGGELEEKMRTAQQGKSDPRTPARPVVAVNEVDLMSILTLLGDFLLHAEVASSRSMSS